MVEFNRGVESKHTGFRHFFSAMRYSLAGLRRLLSESAFRHELLGSAIVLIVLALLGASAGQLLVQTILILILYAIEALNTAVEAIVDRVSPEISDFAAQAKDLGSFAVAAVVAANALHLIAVFVSLFL